MSLSPINMPTCWWSNQGCFSFLTGQTHHFDPSVVPPPPVVVNGSPFSETLLVFSSRVQQSSWILQESKFIIYNIFFPKKYTNTDTEEHTPKQLLLKSCVFTHLISNLLS